MRTKRVDSLQNPTLKWIRKVCADPRKEGFIVFEGEHLVEEAMKSDFVFKMLVATPDKFEKWKDTLGDVEAIVISGEMFDTISINKSPEGVMALGTLDRRTFKAPSSGSAFLYLDEIQDPVNAGIMVRCAHALGYEAVISGKGSVDPFNPTAIARSAGAVFHIPVFRFREEEFLSWAEINGVAIIAAAAGGTPVGMISASLEPPFALVMGNEARGISENILARAKAKVSVPMIEGWDSLNVASAASILMYQLKTGSV